ncbi:MAG TPA: hypothetical protein VFB12_21565 [Ktedonobacteraceae bacterium]|nr:hypothetical protein [Ktedonobacteraceae bacterium]
MNGTTPLTNVEVQNLVYTWFQKITAKVDLDELLQMLSKNELEMRFPETTIRNHGDFKRWYEGVTNLYFDQIHDLKMLAVDLDGPQADVSLVVHWQARTWQPPSAYSKWQDAYIHQRWSIKREAGSDKPVIVDYYVGTFDTVPR